MARIGIDYLCTGTYTSIDSYDSTKWNLGSLINQYTGGGADNFIGPQKIGLAYPSSDNSFFPPTIIDSFTWSSNIDWVFGTRVSSTSFITTFYEYNRNNSSYTYKGYLITNPPTLTGTFTLRGFSSLYYTYTGSATINLPKPPLMPTGKRVIGSGFTSRRIASGARIGFGSTDPTQITTWYTIESIISDTQLDTVGAISILECIDYGGELECIDITYTQAHLYVIEELRFGFTVTNTTATNGGLFLSKGRNYNDFSIVSPTQSFGATGSIDNLSKTYWLADASTVTNTAPSGLSVDGNKKLDFDGLTQSAYVIDTTSSKAYVYNLRASDSITTGKMTLTGSNIAITAAQTITGTLASSYNGKIATTNHGPGKSIKSLYFLSSTRFYRADLSDITTNKTTWFKDARAEISSGGVGTLAASSVLNSLDYDSLSDKFLVYTTAASGNTSYVTSFPDDSGDRFGNTFLLPMRYNDISGDTASVVPIPYNNNFGVVYSSTIGGITHLFKPQITNNSSLFSVPIGAHWEFTSSSNQVAISPIIYTPNNKSFVRVIINNVETLGSEPFFTPLNDIRTYYRTDGLTDNSGKWYSLGPLGDLSFLNGSKSIQFKFEFQMLGTCWGIPGRLLSFVVIYDDLVIQSNHQPSVAFTTDKSFAWRFSATYSSTLPDLRVRLYNTTSNQLLLDDNTASPEGTFEKTTDGGINWTSWDNSDKTNETTYIRYTPSGLSDGLKIRAVLTLNT